MSERLSIDHAAQEAEYIELATHERLVDSSLTDYFDTGTAYFLASKRLDYCCKMMDIYDDESIIAMFYKINEFDTSLPSRKLPSDVHEKYDEVERALKDSGIEWYDHEGEEFSGSLYEEYENHSIVGVVWNMPYVNADRASVFYEKVFNLKNEAQEYRLLLNYVSSIALVNLSRVDSEKAAKLFHKAIMEGDAETAGIAYKVVFEDETPVAEDDGRITMVEVHDRHIDPSVPAMLIKDKEIFDRHIRNQTFKS